MSKNDRFLCNILWYNQLTINDINLVGGKNASLGEMLTNLSQLNILIPDGFAITVNAFNNFLRSNKLDKHIYRILHNTNINNITELTKTSKQIKHWIMNATFDYDLKEDIKQAILKLTTNKSNISFAIRSSATIEDIPHTSCAGQQETFLNVKGINNIMLTIKRVFASLFNVRAISYRAHKGYNKNYISISVGIQRMIRSDLASSGVIFTIDTESGFDQVILITSAYGLGETIVQGSVNPDEFYIHKPTLINGCPAIIRKILGSKKIRMIYNNNDDNNSYIKIKNVSKNKQNSFSLLDKEIEYLANQALIIEKHYGRAMDIEWAKDGSDGKIYIVQARPITVHINKQIIKRYQLKKAGKIIVTGRAIGQSIACGTVRIIQNFNEIHKIKEGDILVTDMTDPNWEPIMKLVSAIVTNRGGRTCHAAIIARELGIPVIVGCENATKILKENQKITVSCAEGDTGFIYEEQLPFVIKKYQINNMPILNNKIMINIGNPDKAFDLACLPNDGVGLARLEFIISHMIGIHPNVLLSFNEQSPKLKNKIKSLIHGYSDPIKFYIGRLTEGIATIAAAFWPKKVIIRLSDFKSNEYANLIGGNLYEPKEENPMLGFRGASRYLDENFSNCFALECEAIKYVRNIMKLTNIEIMIPFVRTPFQAKSIIDILEKNGLKRGDNQLKIIMMCEIPSNALLAKEFLNYFDGFSIGTNDLTQLTLGIDRDSGIIASMFDESNESVKQLISMAIKAAKKEGKYIGICGQGPSDNLFFSKWLINQGIDSISLNHDTIVTTWLALEEKKQRI
nr:MAG: phosphoenolpyruvate synthase [Candidatus Aschnera chinzeii]